MYRHQGLCCQANARAVEPTTPKSMSSVVASVLTACGLSQSQNSASSAASTKAPNRSVANDEGVSGGPRGTRRGGRALRSSSLLARRSCSRRRRRWDSLQEVSSIDARSGAAADEDEAAIAEVDGPASSNPPRSIDEDRLRARNCDDGARILFPHDQRQPLQDPRMEGKVAKVERHAQERPILVLSFPLAERRRK